MSLDPLRFVAVALAGWLNQQQQDVVEYLREENRVLREQLGNRRLRLNDDQRCRMATENRDWGYTRIRGALANLGHRVARGTIANILKQHGIEPAPARLKKTTWQEFLQTHWEVLAAADFFTVEVWTRSGLVRVLVLFVIELSTRRVEIAGISPQPDGAWMTQTARNLTDAGDGFLVGKKYLIHDRDPLFTREFQETLGAAGVRNVRLPARSPNLNAYAERFVRSIKESCLDRMILFGERSLRRAVQEFVAHCHFQRNHQGFDNQLIFPDKSDAKASAPIECRQRLGGMLKYYHRQAA
jgi:transposase InsO family protein